MITAKNIFGLSAPYHNQFRDSCRTHQDSYRKTQQQLSNFFSSPKYKQLHKTMTNDIVIFKAPAAQTMMDIYHQSQKSWPEFIQSTSLSHLQKDNIEIFTPFQSYESQFTSMIHAPLSELLKSKSILFKHDANDIVITLSQIYNALKTRKIPENTCLQIEAQLNLDLHHSSIVSDGYDVDDDSDDDEDGDEFYAEMTRKFNYAAKNEIEKKKNFNHDDKECSDDKEELCQITNVIRNMFGELPTNPYSYKQYEMLLDLNEETIKTSLNKNNKVPHCEFLNAPLCRIFNSIKSIDITNKNLLTFSFHAMSDCVRIYCYTVVNGKIYGSRIFEQDLMSCGMVPSLFEDNEIEGFNEQEVRKNMEGKRDEIYEQYKHILFERNAADLEIIIEENNIESDYLSDDQSIDTVQILNNASLLQSEQSEEISSLKSKLIQFTQIIHLQQERINILEGENKEKDEEIGILKRNCRQMSVGTDNSNSDYSTDSRSDTGGIQTDWSDELQSEVKQCLENSTHQWNFSMNISNSRNINNHFNSSESSNILQQHMAQNESDLTAENLKMHNQQILDENNEIDAQSIHKNDSQVIDDIQENNSDIFDENTSMQNAPMPNVFTGHENIINDNISNFLMPLNDSHSPLRMRQYNKLDTQLFDRGAIYYHNNVLPEMMERLESLSNRLEQLLQAPQDQRIAVNIFQNAWDVYFIMSICLMSYVGFNNLYIWMKYYQCLFKKKL